MSSDKPSVRGDEALRKTMLRLDATIRTFTAEQQKALKLESSFLYSFFKGIASGLGVLVAVSIIVPIAIAMMRSVNWVPIIGKFVAQVTQQIEQVQSAKN